MEYFSHFLLFMYCALLGRQACVAIGPIFINPQLSVDVEFPAEISTTAKYVTQTVYGFLDFTTTIGDTVMIFSPQSSSSSSSVKSSTAALSSKPITSNEETIIRPTKILQTTDSSFSIQSASHYTTVATNLPKESENFGIINPSIRDTSREINAAKIEPTTTYPLEIKSKIEIVSEPISLLDSIQSSTADSAPILSSIVEVKSNDQPAVVLGNNIGDPEYDFLSRQPSEIVDETYKVISLKPSSKFQLKPRSSSDYKQSNNKVTITKRPDSHPTGLVTKLGGTVVKDGVTTVHETSVLGTYISGKYAQVLQSTSHTLSRIKATPSSTLRILKTASASSGGKTSNKRHLEPASADSFQEETTLPAEAGFAQQNQIKSAKKLSSTGSSYKPRYKTKPKEIEIDESDTDIDPTSYSSHKKFNRNRGSNGGSRYSKQNTAHSPHKLGRGSRKTTTSRTVSVHSEEVNPTVGNGKRYQTRRNKQFRLNSPNVESGGAGGGSTNSGGGGYSNIRRGYKPKVQISNVEPASTTTSLYKFKLNRPVGRWQYKTTPKPRVTIRKQYEDEPNTSTINEGLPATPVAPLQNVSALINDVGTPESLPDDIEGLEESESIASIIDDENSTENKLDSPYRLETLKVEISTPPDFKDIYYEIATIKSPYTFQVGNVKNTRYITITSTIEKNLASTTEPSITPTLTEPLTENILATATNYAKDNNLDSSVATLPPIYLESDMITPPLETITETFSTTHTLLKTHILPIIRNGNETTSSTLVQTYMIERLVTATKTLPPMEAYHFIPSKTLNEFNSRLDEAGSELHLELEFGDQNDQEEETLPSGTFPDDLDLANIGTNFDLSDVDKSRIADTHSRLKKTPQKPSTTIATPATSVATAPIELVPNSDQQLQQLALLRLFNPAANQIQVITTSKPIFKLETVYESHVVPITNGPNTILTTISKVVGTVTKTDYEFGTSTVQPAVIPPMPLAPVNPLFPQAQFAITSSPIVQNAFVTHTDSKVLKLTFGAKTAYTTIFSTKIVPTLVTSYITASVPVHPTAAFPGFFPAPYPAYPFVG